MGTVYRGKCPLCGYTQQFFLGGGLMSINLEMSMEALPDRERAGVKKMMEQQEICDFHVENHITECPECGELMGKMIIRITGHDGKQYVFGWKCNHCGKPVKIYCEQEEAKVKCPECHKGVLALEQTGLWD